MPDPAPESSSSSPSVIPAPAGVRYSLPELLREVEQERRESAFAMEMLDQLEIGKMFVNRKRRRVRNKIQGPQ